MKTSMDFLIAALILLFNRLIEERIWFDCLKKRRFFLYTRIEINDGCGGGLMWYFENIWNSYFKLQFRKGFSTNKVLLTFIGEMGDSFDNNTVTYALFCDLSMAFELNITAFVTN